MAQRLERRMNVAGLKLEFLRALRVGCLLLGVVGLVLGVGCEQKPTPAGKDVKSGTLTKGAQPAAKSDVAVQKAEPGAKAAESPASAPAKAEPPQVPAAAAKPAPAWGQPTGTFLDREDSGDLRFVCYNVNWNNIFAEVSPANADKFVRVMRALQPDVLAIQEIGWRNFLDKQPKRGWSAEDVAFLMNAILPTPDGAKWQAFSGDDTVIVSRYPLSHEAKKLVPAGERELAMAMVDVPESVLGAKLYVLNNHFKCCDPAKFDGKRQQQADALVSWLRDARTPGGEIDLPAKTAIIVCGDLNIVGSDQPVKTLVAGDIQDEAQYGKDFAIDWDDSALTDAHPLHNVDGPDDYTWRDDTTEYQPGRLDYILYTDSVLATGKVFALDTMTLSDEELTATGLQKFDVSIDDVGKEIDHYPLVVDFRAAAKTGKAGE